MWAAILYFVDASLLAITFWGASTGHYRKDFILTVSQRTLMLQTIMLLIYLLLGAFIFSEIESWNYLDAVYWTVVTLFTVGFGDYYPTTDLGRALLIPYALIGIITFGLVISSVRSLILEHGRRCIAARMDDRKRRKMIRTILRSGDDKTLEPIREEFETSPTQSNKALANEFERRKAEFALMRKIQAKSSSRRRWVAMAISTFLWLVLWLVGAVIFEKAEKPYQSWSYFDAVYFCFEAWTTIGYGDLAPISNAGRSFYVFWSLLALPTMTVLISHASDTVVRIIRDGTILLGNVTILPNDGGFVRNMKQIISKITFGKAFPHYRNSSSPELAVSSKNIDQRLPGIMAESYEQTLLDAYRGCPSASGVNQGVSQNNGPQSTGASSTFTCRLRCNHRDELPTGTNFHFLLISEIQVIATHLEESKPHRYTFDQWAWYLRLIGEDEHNPQTHCKVKLKGKRQDPNDEDPDRGLTWSWVGNRSPLIGNQEESEWILGSLIARLRESLLAERRRQLGSSAKVAHQEAQDVQDFDGGGGAEK
jgi:potassium channel subfamily K